MHSVVIASLVTNPLWTVTVFIVGGLLTASFVALTLARAKRKRSRTNARPLYPTYQPYSPPQGQNVPQSKDNTAILVAIIGALATIVAALITALIK